MYHQNIQLFLSFLCATYAFTCQSQSSLAEFPECWVKPAAELSMSTSDAFTVPCSQPSEYFPKPSLAWLLHSASSQVFAVACVSRYTHKHTQTHTHTITYLYPLPTTVESSCVYVLFPSWISPPYLLHHTVSPSGSLFILVFSPTTYFSLVLSSFFNLSSLPFSSVSQPCISPLLYDDHALQLFVPLIFCSISFFNRMSPLTFSSTPLCLSFY